MPTEQVTPWESRYLAEGHKFALMCEQLRDSNPYDRPALNDVVEYPMTELWDRNFSQSEIKAAFEYAVACLPGYAAGEERRAFIHGTAPMPTSHFEFKVSLMFKSATGDLQEICDAIGLVPKRRWIVGHPRKTPTGTSLPGIYRDSYCYFDLKREPKEGLCEMLSRVADRLAEHRALFVRLRDDGGSIYFCVSWLTGQNRGETFTEDLLRKLADLRIDLGVEVWNGSDA